MSTEMKKLDISNETWREYVYKDGHIYRIENPQLLFIKDGGTGHRVIDKAGTVHWVPVNVWHAIRWQSPDGVSF